MYYRKAFSTLTALAFLVLVSLSVQAAQVQLDVSGSLTDAFNIGGSFSASFVYDDDTLNANSVLVEASNDVAYLFLGAPYGVSATVGSEHFAFGHSLVGVADDYIVSVQDSIDTLGYFPAGVHDAFGVVSVDPLSAFAGSFDTDLENGVVVGAVFFTDTAFQNGVDAIGVPPTLADATSAFFMVAEFVNGNATRGGFGPIDSMSVTPVPLPAAVWMFLGALALLSGRTVVRRRGET